MFKRVIIIVVASVRISTLPILASYGKLGVHVFAEIILLWKGLYLPTLGKMGLGSIDPLLKLNAFLSPWQFKNGANI